MSNRAERRRNEREENKRNTSTIVQHYKAHEFQKMLDQRSHEDIKGTIETMCAIMAISLNSEFGFGTARINKLVERMRLQFQCIENDTIKISDIIHWCNENKIKFLR